ncbi:NAD(P)-binding protein [Melanogaster broomeanus]|nr:NAD(P)-binding protein [Melanogaster broomeanus]
MPSINDSKCILVIGSTSGIGRHLALSILELPSKPTVIVCGRRQERLDELLASRSAEGRLHAVRLDVNLDRPALKSTIENIVKSYPELDAVMFSSGVQDHFNFAEPENIDLDLLETELNTNYTSVVSMITFFLPHLLKIGETRPAFIYTITSGLAITPAPTVPNYSATKAALHSLSLTLNTQLKDKNVHVVEIMPPLVESELHDHQGTRETLSKFWMTLDDFTKLTMAGLVSDSAQIPIGQSVDSYNKFEQGKLEVVQAFAIQMKAVANAAARK